MNEQNFYEASVSNESMLLREQDSEAKELRVKTFGEWDGDQVYGRETVAEKLARIFDND